MPPEGRLLPEPQVMGTMSTGAGRPTQKSAGLQDELRGVRGAFSRQCPGLRAVQLPSPQRVALGVVSEARGAPRVTGTREHPAQEPWG